MPLHMGTVIGSHTRSLEAPDVRSGHRRNRSSSSMRGRGLHSAWLTGEAIKENIKFRVIQIIKIRIVVVGAETWMKTFRFCWTDQDQFWFKRNLMTKTPDPVCP
ncbi:hypothetical protein E3U43_016400 [Larimichthys crocea]|uniref:Uncharacterized protein n=1 Tax=Larimichthys crocea TaxID=215358 RepID=A0ACD3QHF8_LARCR|nr:hypothetical protein E3U43_016400 [Larimichthys crocea]